MTGNVAVRHLAIDGEFNIYQAQSLREQLLAALGEGCEVEVDLAGVTDVDSAGLQLMIAAKREAATRGTSLRFLGHSTAVVDLFDLCDPSAHLGDPVLIPRHP